MRWCKAAALGCVLVLLAGVSARADKVDDLIKDLGSGDSAKELQAVIFLKQMQDPRVTKAVIARAADATAPLSVRRQCIDVIREQKLMEGLGTLLDIAGNAGQPPAVRDPAIIGVVVLSGSEHVGLLIKLIREDQSPLIRETAAAALGIIRDPKIIPQVTTLLDDPKTAPYGVAALSAIGDTSVVPNLIDKLKTDNAALRNTIIEALGRLGDKRAVAPLLELLKQDNEYQKVLIIAALGKINDPAVVSRLTALVSDKAASESVRTRALLSIASLKATTALSTVAGVATSPAEKIRVRQAAISTLGSLGDTAIPALIPLLDDKALSGDAALALGHITSVYLGTDRAAWTQWYNDYKTRKKSTGP